MSMIPYNDNEIEVLGQHSEPINQPDAKESNDAHSDDNARQDSTLRSVTMRLVFVSAVAILALLIYICVLLSRTGNNHTEQRIEPTEIAAAMVEEAAAETVPHSHRVEVVTDSINDVAFTFCHVDSLRAELAMGAPDHTDSTIIVATAAADYRGDGKGVVGDFILNGEQRANGTRKEGWCYISKEGTVSIGIGDAESAKDEALKHGDSFFRQYALVMDGEICPNVLKGKAKRRAIAFLDERPVIVKSINRESVYDFSQALADYGFSHALYLPGGEGFWLCRTKDGDVYANDHPADSPYVNYIIFR